MMIIDMHWILQPKFKIYETDRHAVKCLPTY